MGKTGRILYKKPKNLLLFQGEKSCLEGGERHFFFECQCVEIFSLDSRSPIGTENKIHGNDKIVHISTSK